MIKAKVRRFFEVTSKFYKTMELGVLKRVRETNCFVAETFADAEHMAEEKVAPLSEGEFEVVGVVIAPYTSYIYDDEDESEAFYKVKVGIVSIDEKTGKEKTEKTVFLVNAGSLEDAKKRLDAYMEGSMLVYKVISVVETSISDIFDNKHE